MLNIIRYNGTYVKWFHIIFENCSKSNPTPLFITVSFMILNDMWTLLGTALCLEYCWDGVKHRTISQSMNITAYHTLHNVQVLSIMNCMVFCWWKKGSPDFRKITNSVSIKSMQCHVVPLEFIILNLLKNISPSLSIYSIQCQIQTLPQW